jgi:hypothetical protein
MAITQKAAPVFDYVTAYNPVVFAVDSDNKAEAGFRYVFDIYSGGTNVKLAEYLIAPRIGDGFGVVDISKVLQNSLSYDVDFTNGVFEVKNSWVNFDVKVGESYSTSWDYNVVSQYIQSGSTSNGYTVLSSSTGTHSYNIGDVIVVNQFSTTSFPNLEGIQVVRLVPNSNSIVLDLPYTNVTTSSGSTTFANNARLITRDLASYTGYTAINGVVPYLDKRFTRTSYRIINASTTRRFLTTRPSGIRARVDQDFNFNILIDANATWANRLRIINSNGDIFTETINNSTEPLIGIEVGPNNIQFDTIVSGTGPIIKDDTEWYEFFTTTSGGTQTSQSYRVNLDRRCGIDYNGGEACILFKDRLGAMSSFSFPLRKNRRIETTKKDYKKTTGFINTSLSPDSWDYNPIDNGIVTIYSDEKVTYTLNTDWMTEEESAHFEELITSSVTLIKFGDRFEYQPVKVLTSNFTTNYQRNKKLFLATIEVEISNQNNINV